MSKYKRVTKKEYLSFVSNYPKELVYDVCAIAEPPVANYNDFSDGKVWPESCVTKVILCPKKPEYFIAKEFL